MPARRAAMTAPWITVWVAVLTAVSLSCAAAQDATKPLAPPQNYPAQKLLSTGKTVVGETIHYPRTGPANVTAAIVTLPPGGTAFLHKHGAPLFAYILDGELTVDYGTHGKRTYRKGDALVEAMGVAHSSINNGTETMRLIGVYMGAQGTKDVIPVAATAPVTPAGRWQAQTIQGTPVNGDKPVILDLGQDGRVSGNGGCNTIGSRATIRKSAITFHRPVGTLMACPPAIMEQERKFLDALTRTRRWRIDAAGKLLLSGAYGKPLATFTKAASP